MQNYKCLFDIWERVNEFQMNTAQIWGYVCLQWGYAASTFKNGYNEFHSQKKSNKVNLILLLLCCHNIAASVIKCMTSLYTQQAISSVVDSSWCFLTQFRMKIHSYRLLFQSPGFQNFWPFGYRLWPPWPSLQVWLISKDLIEFRKHVTYVYRPSNKDILMDSEEGTDGDEMHRVRPRRFWT